MQIIKYKGYSIKVDRDEGAENPFTKWDTEPPILVDDGGRYGGFTTYQGAPESLAGIVALMPDSLFARGQRVKTIRDNLNCSLREYAQHRRDNTYYKTHPHPVRDAFAEILSDEIGATPEGWRAAGEWFDTAESLLRLAGIACHSTESRGYSQGDVVKILAIATPEWVQLVGAPADSLERQCRAACDLYGAWAWGDVYGIAGITGPDGEGLDDGSVWGFYGSDHETSGLMESARDSVDYHIARAARVKTISRHMCLA